MPPRSKLRVWIAVFSGLLFTGGVVTALSLRSGQVVPEPRIARTTFADPASTVGGEILACVLLNEPAMAAKSPVDHSAEPPDIYNLPAGAVGVDEWRLKYFCPGDFNKDNRVDPEDLNLYVAVFSAREGPMSEWLDIDQDGEVSVDDLSSMIRFIQEGGCDPEEQSKNRLLVC